MSSSRFPILRGLDPLVSRLQDNIAAVLGPLSERLSSTPIMGAAPPPWTNIEPLLNGFAFVPALGTVAPSFHVDALGYVHCRGVAQCAAGVGANTSVAYLPPQARPGVTHIFPLFTAVGVVAGVSVWPTGEVHIINATAAGNGLSFEFSFLAGA